MNPGKRGQAKTGQATAKQRCPVNSEGKMPGIMCPGTIAESSGLTITL
ncbi:MAG: hypothetical protein ABL962_08195 [Fimbriimonadaceae bacterium]